MKLSHPGLPHSPVIDVPTAEAAAVLRESGWVDYVAPEPTPGIVPGTEDPPKPTRKRKESTPAGAEGDDQQ